MFGVEQFLQTQSAVFIDRSSLVNLGIGSVCGFAVLCSFVQTKYQYKMNSVLIASVLLILLSQASQFWTIAPKAFAQYYSRTPLPYYVLYLLVAPVLSQGKNGVRNGIWSTVYIGIPMIFLVAFFVEWSGRGVLLAKPVMENGRLTLYAPPLSIADAAAYIGISCIILKPKNAISKLLHIATFALACYIVYRTQSRGQLIALGVVALLFYPVANQATKAKNLLITMVGFIFIGLALYAVFTFLDLGSVNRWNEKNMRMGTEGRLHMVTMLLTAWSQSNPFYLLFGLGSGAGWATSGFDVHNLPAGILGELGIIGFSLYCFICFKAFSCAIKVIQKLKHYPDTRREAVILIAIFTYTFILTFKSISLFSSAPLMFFFAIALCQLEKQSHKFRAEKIQWKHLLLVSAAPQNSLGYAPRHR